MKILVGRKGPGAHYSGRGSPLGNPFVIGRDGDRDEVCEKYERWFARKISEPDPEVMEELRSIYRKAKRDGRVVLGCYCAPARCHGETIKRFIEECI